MLVLYFAMERRSGQRFESGGDAARPAFKKFGISDIARIKLQSADHDITLVKKKDDTIIIQSSKPTMDPIEEWGLAATETSLYPSDKSKHIQKFLEGLQKVTRGDLVATKKSSHAELGVDKVHALRVSLFDNSGKSVGVFYVGYDDPEQPGSGFIRTDKKNEVFRLRDFGRSDLDRDRYFWMDRSFIEKITFASPNGNATLMNNHFRGTGWKWTVAMGSNSYPALDQEAISALVERMNSLSAKDIVPNAAPTLRVRASGDEDQISEVLKSLTGVKKVTTDYATPSGGENEPDVVDFLIEYDQKTNVAATIEKMKKDWELVFVKKDFSNYGLGETRALEVSIQAIFVDENEQTREENIGTLLLGAATVQGRMSTFAAEKDGNSVFRVDGIDINAFSKSVGEAWVDKTILDMNPQNVVNVAFADYQLQLQAPGQWKVVKGDNTYDADTTKVQDFLNALKDLTAKGALDKPYSYDALMATPTLSFEIHESRGKQVVRHTLLVGNQVADEDSYYISDRAASPRAVFTIASASVEPLKKNYNDFLPTEE